MELIDRYLQTVRRFLPKSQRDDIIRELSENLRSQIEDREAQFGRPLNEAEHEQILKQHGHPLLVADRYQSDQRNLTFGRLLVGPVLFPLYAKVLWFNLGITTVACPVVTLMLGKPLLEAVPAILTHLLVQFAIVTTIFTAAQEHLARLSDGWDPRNPLAVPPVENDAQVVPRMESFAQLVALGVFLSWLLAVRCSPDLITDSASAVFRFGAVWNQMHLPLVLLTMAGLMQACVNLVRPDWMWLRSAMHVGGGIVWLMLLCFILMASDWVVLAHAASPPADHVRELYNVNRWIFFTVLTTALVSVVILWFDARRLIRDRRARPPREFSQLL